MIEWNEVINVNAASWRSARLPGRTGAQLQNLFVVVASMHHMKLSPLWRSQWAQNRVVEHVDAAPEARFALRDDGVHRLDLCRDLVSHRVDRQAFRHRYRRRLDPAGHVTQSHDDESSHPLRHRGPRAQRFSAGDYSF